MRMNRAITEDRERAENKSISIKAIEKMGSIIQFMHPGKEHTLGRSGVVTADGAVKFWETRAHGRKFLKAGGKYLDLATGQVKVDPALCVWCEAEWDTRAVGLSDRAVGFPKWEHSFLPEEPASE